MLFTTLLAEHKDIATIDHKKVLDTLQHDQLALWSRYYIIAAVVFECTRLHNGISIGILWQGSIKGIPGSYIGPPELTHKQANVVGAP